MERIMKWDLQKVVFIITCVIVAECCLLTSGRLFSIGPLSFRMIMIGVAGILTIPFLIKKLIPVIKNPFIIAIIGFLGVLFIGLVRAIAVKQDLSFAVYMLKGCLYLIWLPILLFAIQNRRQLEIIFGIVVICGTLLSIFTICISLIGIHKNEWITPLYNFLNTNNYGMLYMPTFHLARFLPGGIMAEIAACGGCGYFYVVYPKLRRYSAFLTGINLIGIWLTYTRGVYLGTAVAVIVMTTLCLLGGSYIRKQFARFVGTSLIVTVAIVILLGCINRCGVMSYGFMRLSSGTFLEPMGQAVYELSLGRFAPTVPVEEPDGEPGTETEPGTDTEPGTTQPGGEEIVLPDLEIDKERESGSASIRSQMTVLLNKLIQQNPWFGNGLGAHIDFRDGYVEMLWHDLISKVGIVGTVILLIPLGIMLVRVFKKGICLVKLRKSFDVLYMAQVTAVVGIIAPMVSSFSNPYLLGGLGLFFYCLAMRLFSVENILIEGFDSDDKSSTGTTGAGRA